LLKNISMLKVFKKVFTELNVIGIDYIIYKSLNCLKEDLMGLRGDIDVLVEEAQLKRFKTVLNDNFFFFALNKSKKGPSYFLSLDLETHNLVMLDVNTKIQFGSKPFKPYILHLKLKDFKIFLNESDLKLLHHEDYIPLMFMMRVVSKSEKIIDLNELKDFIKSKNILSSHSLDNLEKMTNQSWSEISNNILKASDWSLLKNEYSQSIISKSAKNKCFSFKNKFPKFFIKINWLKTKYLNYPSYRIRSKGFLVAFVGVDGSGKSSLVDYISNLEFFKLTGVKRIYFGNNEYWIPGLVFMLKRNKSKLLRVFFRAIATIDRRGRMLYAKHLIRRGYVVLADRYFYDDLIGEELKNKKRSIWENIYHKVFFIKNFKKPELVIFMDVSPEVAYQRKQDYSYDIMLKMNKTYKDFMYKVDDVLIVDADKTQKEVYFNVIKAILEIDKKNN
jgi:thymidylate kinase